MACLIVTEGPAVGRHLDLGQHRIVMVGRDRDCTFQILDDRMSRHHLQVKTAADGKTHVAVDFGSTNGVFVNEVRIEAETPLTDGDVVRIGDTALVYMTEPSRIAERLDALKKQAGERFRGTVVTKRPPKEG